MGAISLREWKYLKRYERLHLVQKGYTLDTPHLEEHKKKREELNIVSVEETVNWPLIPIPALWPYSSVL